jgi:energy-coupling factor transporter transmembrane protein EcfT
MLDHYWSAFFLLGLLVVTAFAWRQFNEPSFPSHQALPRTVDPLRYLFLKAAYRKARFIYLFALLLLYALLVAPGPKIVPALGAVGIEKFPDEGWALLAALIITGVGLAPDSWKWFHKVEELLRQWIHAWFLVPDGIERTIGVLEDAQHEPTPSQLALLQSSRKERVQEDLKCLPETLRYRWARATILVTWLKQIGAGGAGPLRKANFDPFEEDFDAILEKYRALKPDVEALGAGATSNYTEDQLSRWVDCLLRRVYAYISWGVRNQADSEREVYDTLEELGFRIPKIGGRRLFDIVSPAVLLIALIAMLFWITNDAVKQAMGLPAPRGSDSIVSALSAAMAACLMYGGAVLIALRRRSAQIERRLWRERSPRCLIPIAIRAGLVTWAVITATTVLWGLSDTWQSLAGIVALFKSPAGDGSASALASAKWLPIRIATALPWLLAGATASAVLATSLAGDARLTDRSQRAVDAIFLGSALALAVGWAALLQYALTEKFEGKPWDLGDVISLGLAGFACGAVIGFKVPWACKTNLVTPPDRATAGVLWELLVQAESELGSKVAAQNWIFSPNADLGGITPAEAVQYTTRATGVKRLLESEASARREQARAERPLPVVIEGGRGAA